MGKLIHLRYLNLEGNRRLRNLPPTLCDLCNLQTLNIRSCSSLKGLPYGIERLINLRHLQNAETYGFKFMESGIQRLTRLQTLEDLGALGGLAHLRENLKIIGLGNLSRMNEEAASHIPPNVRRYVRKWNESSRQNETEKVGLVNKTGLRNLTLSFNSDSKDLSIMDEAFVLEALQSPPFPEYLNINRMNGPTLFSSWMASLTMLKRVILWACFNWETLPLMGKLSFLEHLEIWKMKKVKKVGQEFMGAEREEGQTSFSSSSSVNNNMAFPSLKYLKFKIMEEWEYGNLLTIMPCLCSLNINSCLKLKSRPHHLLQKTTLRELDIFDCLILKNHCLRNGRGED
ncbi:hypothetical protein CRYUN_Cryun34aG0070000 [Craigia yunnanensis]